MRNESKRSVLLFGGAGFIGSNWAQRLLDSTDAQIHIFDNLSREGSLHNVTWLKSQDREGDRIRVTIGDVRDANAVTKAVRLATEVYNFAAQVAVTTSIKDPRHDFEVNLQGTFNILEAARKSGHAPFLLFTSTNKVYGEMGEHLVSQTKARYEYADIAGITEEQPLNFHSPYGCSKGAADQYVRDYGRIFGLPTVVFRMSCIAGARQFGNEDQGWVAHFLYSALENKPVRIYGDGRQVRDILNVVDLLRAFEAANASVATTAGQIYNIGGGAANTTSLLELAGSIEALTGKKLELEFSDFRPGDQRIFVTDCSKIRRDTAWTPSLDLKQTLHDIREFWRQNRELLADQFRTDGIPEPEVIFDILGRSA